MAVTARAAGPAPGGAPAPVAADRGPAEPDPVREVPPADRYCDLVLNGGVASGVAYPWALVELARRYRFRNIGGNSVGAMAAAMAAAAEYGRCMGVEDAFEPLRRFPLELAAERDGVPRMLRLFQPPAALRRLFQVFLLVVRSAEGAEHMAPAARPRGPAWRVLLRLYVDSLPLAVSAAAALALLAVTATTGLDARWGLGCVGVLAGLVAGAVAVAVGALRRDLAAFEANDYGLCRGRHTGGEEALVDWLHRGIQVSAGRGEHEPPLTFADLWAAPRFGRAGPPPDAGGGRPAEPAIDLQMFSSNVTLGAPVRLPLGGASARLYFHPDEWAPMFPDTVLRALAEASTAYAPATGDDPASDAWVAIGPAGGAARRRVRADELREVPGGGLPVVVAARLSLCFPVLFSAVPVYAVDADLPAAARALRRCLLSDGGLCSNFPVHLFDAACPRWPTFAFLLDQRAPGDGKAAVTLPRTHLEGGDDDWQRAVPGAELDAASASGRPATLATRLGGLAAGLLLTTKDWNDRVTGRLPTVRNRVVRLALRRGEGSLNIAMPGATMLRMAAEYGVASAARLVAQFAPDDDGAPAQGWRDHLYVRSVVELRSLRAHLRNYGRSVQARAHTLPLAELLAASTAAVLPATAAERLRVEAPPRPLARVAGRADPAGDPLRPEQRDALGRAVRAVEALEAELAACEALLGPYRPVPAPELRLRPPV